MHSVHALAQIDCQDDFRTRRRMTVEGFTSTPALRPRPSRCTTSILLVDDHPSNLLALEAILEPLGQRLVLASSGRGGAAAPAARGLRRHPAGRADAGAGRLRDGQAHPPAASARATRPSSSSPPRSRDESDLFHGYAQGAVDYVVKPFNPDMLRSKVEVFVDAVPPAAAASAPGGRAVRSWSARCSRGRASCASARWWMRCRCSSGRCFRTGPSPTPTACWLEYAGLPAEQGRTWEAIGDLPPGGLQRARAAWASRAAAPASSTRWSTGFVASGTASTAGSWAACCRSGTSGARSPGGSSPPRTSTTAGGPSRSCGPQRGQGRLPHRGRARAAHAAAGRAQLRAPGARRRGRATEGGVDRALQGLGPAGGPDDQAGGGPAGREPAARRCAGAGGGDLVDLRELQQRGGEHARSPGGAPHEVGGAHGADAEEIGGVWTRW